MRVADIAQPERHIDVTGTGGHETPKLRIGTAAGVATSQRGEVILEESGPECASHSIRRSAAQWAARCGASLNITRDIGRWQTVQTPLVHLAEGQRQSEEAAHGAENGVDPVHESWPFDFDTMNNMMDGVLMD